MVAGWPTSVGADLEVQLVVDDVLGFVVQAVVVVAAAVAEVLQHRADRHLLREVHQEGVGHVADLLGRVVHAHGDALGDSVLLLQGLSVRAGHRVALDHHQAERHRGRRRHCRGRRPRDAPAAPRERAHRRAPLVGEVGGRRFGVGDRGPDGDLLAEIGELRRLVRVRALRGEARDHGRRVGGRRRRHERERARERRAPGAAADHDVGRAGRVLRRHGGDRGRARDDDARGGRAADRDRGAGREVGARDGDGRAAVRRAGGGRDARDPQRRVRRGGRRRRAAAARGEGE